MQFAAVSINAVPHPLVRSLSGACTSAQAGRWRAALRLQVLSKTWGGMIQDFAAPPGSNQDFENKLFGCPLGRSDVPLQHFFAGNSVARAGHSPKIQLPPHDELARYPALRTPAALRRRPRHARRRFRAAHLVVVTVYAHAPAPRRTRTKFAGRKTADGVRNLGEKERALFNARDRFT